MNEANNKLAGGAQRGGNRIGWIDCARGIAMLFVVLGHCYMGLEDPVNRFILSFHMPVFFFLSGMCAKASDGTFSAWAAKKARGLLVPQLTLAAIVFIYAVASHGMSTETLIDSLLVWFLPTLYICALLFYLLARFAGVSLKAWALVLCAVAVAAPIVDLLDIDVCPIRPETVLAGLFFFCLGHVWRLVAPKAGTFGKPGMWVTAVFLVPVLYVLSQLNAPIAMYEGTYGFWPLFYLTAAVGTAWVCLLGRLLEGVSFLAWFGQVSVIVFVLHFRLIPLLRAITVRALSVVGLSLGTNEMAVLLFVLAMAILVPLVGFCDKYLGFLFGKSKAKKA